MSTGDTKFGASNACQQCVAPKFMAVWESCANCNSSKHTPGSDFTHGTCKMGLALDARRFYLTPQANLSFTSPITMMSPSCSGTWSCRTETLFTVRGWVSGPHWALKMLMLMMACLA